MLRRHRRAARRILEQLAEVSGVSARALSGMERGRSKGPQQRTVTALADALALAGEECEQLIALAREGRLRDHWARPSGLCELPRSVADFTGPGGGTGLGESAGVRRGLAGRRRCGSRHRFRGPGQDDLRRPCRPYGAAEPTHPLRHRARTPDPFLEETCWDVTNDCLYPALPRPAPGARGSILIFTPSPRGTGLAHPGLAVTAPRASVRARTSQCCRWT
ncbi:helix-turn-helix domain-containing protein [Streptomyces sp. NPDC057748]|uniref:helix-turn-helix domain-containing protein n=1 Tax=unclassified Streptomyces TaxID=2593676 RepID=UPI0036CFC2A9